MRLAARVDRTTERTGDLHILLAVSSIAAGVIHAAVVPEHLEEEWIFGVFFIAVAGFQTGWAIRVLFRPSAILYEIGALGNGALIGIWVVSRTVGLPIGSDAWMPERVGTADITATLLELLLFVGSLVLVQRRVHAEGYGVGSRPVAKGGSGMCLTRGCMLPHDDHGNPDYLTIEDLETSAAADFMGLDEAVRNLVATVEVAKGETDHEHR